VCSGEQGVEEVQQPGPALAPALHPQVESRSMSQEHSCAEAEGALIAGHAICKHEFLIGGSSSGEAYSCSLRKVNRAAGGAGGGSKASTSRRRHSGDGSGGGRRDEKRSCTRNGEAARPQRVRCAGMG
jgi:hypothetical protein